MNVGLYFGSFNPIHTGHIAIAEYVLSYAHLDEIRFVVSPQNPFKQSTNLAPTEHRLAMARLATQSNPRLVVDDIETTLPTPSYTVNTIRAIQQRRPTDTLYIIMGADNLPALPRWREAEYLFANCQFIIYPRQFEQDREATPLPPTAKIKILPPTTELLDISSTQIRELIANGQPFAHLVPPAVGNYIANNKLYLHAF